MALMGKVLEPCTPYKNNHYQSTVERKGASSDGKSPPAASNGMSNINNKIFLDYSVSHYFHFIPYSGKIWQGECLANLLFSSVWRKKVWRISRSSKGLLM